MTQPYRILSKDALANRSDTLQCEETIEWNRLSQLQQRGRVVLEFVGCWRSASLRHRRANQAKNEGNSKQPLSISLHRVRSCVFQPTGNANEELNGAGSAGRSRATPLQSSPSYQCPTTCIDLAAVQIYLIHLIFKGGDTANTTISYDETMASTDKMIRVLKILVLKAAGMTLQVSQSYHVCLLVQSEIHSERTEQY